MVPKSAGPAFGVCRGGAGLRSHLTNPAFGVCRGGAGLSSNRNGNWNRDRIQGGFHKESMGNP